MITAVDSTAVRRSHAIMCSTCSPDFEELPLVPAPPVLTFLPFSDCDGSQETPQPPWFASTSPTSPLTAPSKTSLDAITDLTNLQTKGGQFYQRTPWSPRTKQREDIKQTTWGRRDRCWWEWQGKLDKPTMIAISIESRIPRSRVARARETLEDRTALQFTNEWLENPDTSQTYL
jgi:hypothetical protein